MGRKRIHPLKPTPRNIDLVYAQMDKANPDLWGVKLGKFARDKDYTIYEIAEYLEVSEYLVVEWYRGRVGMIKPYIEKVKHLIEKLT
jgi:hypothetical protein